MCTEEICEIPNGVSVNGFSSERLKRDAQSIKGNLGIGEENEIILAVGRNHPVKGYKYLIKAIAKVKKEEKLEGDDYLRYFG